MLELVGWVEALRNPPGAVGGARPPPTLQTPSVREARTAMPAQKIDGQALAKAMRAEIADGVARHVSAGGRPPGLAAVLVGDNPASEVYVRNKRKACEDAGMASWLHRLPAAATQQQLLDLVEQLNRDAAVSGILVQLPLPKQIDESAIIRAVNPLK